MYGNEGAMGAMLGRDKLDGGIFNDLCSYEGCIRDKGVILRGDHERGHADLRGDPFRADVFVIILGVAIAELWGRDDVVKLTDGSDRSEAGERVALRK